jgi:hypothetical protein
MLGSSAQLNFSLFMSGAVKVKLRLFYSSHLPQLKRWVKMLNAAIHYGVLTNTNINTNPLSLSHANKGKVFCQEARIQQ